MKKKLQPKLLLFIFLYFFYSEAMAQDFSLASANSSPNPSFSQSEESISLKDFLKKLEQEYEIKFAYDEDLIKTKYLLKSQAENLDQNPEVTLYNVLDPLKLLYKRIDEKHFVIREKPTTERTDRETDQGFQESSRNRSNNFLSKKRFPSLLIFSKNKVEQIISGRVTVEGENAPLPGVTVLVKGTTTGTVTDANGRYTINVPNERDTLVFSFIGFNTQEVPVSGRTVIDVSLVEDVKSLEEVVVLGYSTQRKADLTGSVASISADELQRTQPSHTVDALRGKIPGVQIMTSDGAPGSGVNIRIRGASSITAGSSPLYVIDGFPVPISDDPMDNPLNTIPPDAIESITILKDVSSTAIYGAQGANGVVVITTKTAAEGVSEFSFKATAGISNITRPLPMLNNEEYMRAYMLEQVMTGRWENVDFYEEYANQIWDTDPSRFTNYQDETLKTGIRKEYELSYLGGTKNVKNSTILSYLDDEGIAINTGFKRIYLRSNTNVQLLPKLNVDANVAYEHSDRKGLNWDLNGNGGIFNDIATFSPLIPREWTFQEVDDNLFYTGKLDNPYRRLNDISLIDNRTQFTGQLELNYEILDGLMLKGGVGVRLPRNEYRKFVPTTIRSSFESKGEAQFRSQTGTNLRYVSQLTYSKNINTDNHFSVSGVVEANSFETESFRQDYTHFDTNLGWYGILAAQKGDFVTPPAVNYFRHTMLSGLIFGNYSLKDKYLFKASLRADASSRFGPENRWGFFPSGAFGWRISDEEFFKSSGFLSGYITNAKLRVSYGSVGNNQINDYIFVNSLAANPRSAVFYNTSPDSDNGIYNSAQPITSLALATAKKVNPEVGWETTTELNMGIDLGLFNNRLNFTADVYQKKTTDMLLNQNLPMISGFDEVTKNVGSVRSRGLELGINSLLVRKKDFSWDASFNISFNRSEILDLGDEGQMLESRFVGATNSTENVLLKEGYPIGLLYGLQVEGIRSNWNLDDNGPSSAWWFASTREAPYGFISFADINGDGFVDLNDRLVLGNVNPVFIGGFNQQFRYKIFELAMNFSSSYGNDIINGNFYNLFHQGGSINNKQQAYMEAAWFANNPDGTYPGPGPVNWMGYQQIASNSEIVEDGSYLKMNYLSMGVNIPVTEVWKIKLLRLTYSLYNVFVWTNYSGYDPEVSTGSNIDTRILSGVDFSAYPYARTHALTLNVKF